MLLEGMDMYLTHLIILLVLSCFYGYYSHIKHVRLCKTLGLDVNFPFMSDDYRESCYLAIKEYKRKKKRLKRKKTLLKGG